MNNEKFELFAIIELMGHQKMSGKVTEQTIGSASFIRVDVPETKNVKEFTRFINPSSIYAINPVTEEIMKDIAENISFQPLKAWDFSDEQKIKMAISPPDDFFEDDED